VVSSSANTKDVLEVTGLAEFIELRVDGVTGREEHLRGKPAPDTFLAAAERLGVEPAAAAVFEDALAGVEAGRAGKFGVVVGVDRVGQADALAEHGATIVVSDLAELLDGDDG
jgi:beta-phosphoglucomutase-like phosphatase (HAD superfamily)